MTLIKNRLLRFLIVGVINTIFSYVVFVILFYFIENKEVAVTLSFIIAVLFNYQTISKLVFADANQRKFILFISIYILTYLLNLLHLYITVDMYGLNVYFSQFITLLYLPLVSFYLNKKYVYSVDY